MRSWSGKLRDETGLVLELRERLERWEPAPGAAPQWFLLRELLIRLGRVERLAEAARQLGVTTRRSPQDAIEAVRETARQLLERESLRREMAENAIGPRLAYGLRDPWAALAGGEDAQPPEDRARTALELLWSLEDEGDLRAQAGKLNLSLPTRRGEAPTVRAWLDAHALATWLTRLEPSERYRLHRLALNYRAAWLLVRDVRAVAENPFLQVLPALGGGEGALLTEREIDGFLAEADIEPSMRQMLHGILRRVDNGIRDVGFRPFVEILHQGEGAAGGAGGDINIIPSTAPGVCRPVVVATVQGLGRGRHGMRRVLQNLRQHLYRCKGIVQVALVITDAWDAEAFDSEHADDWRAFADEGVRFGVFLSASDGSGLAHLNLDLSS